MKRESQLFPAVPVHLFQLTEQNIVEAVLFRARSHAVSARVRQCSRILTQQWWLKAEQLTFISHLLIMYFFFAPLVGVYFYTPFICSAVLRFSGWIDCLKIPQKA